MMNSTKRLPLLDIRQWRSSPQEFAEKLRKAAHQVGFFTLKHDLDVKTTQQIMNSTRTFFEEPIETKLKLSYENSSAFRGYMALGKENTSGKTDWREQVELASEGTNSSESDSNDPRYYYDRLRGKNPALGHELQSAVDNYVKEAASLSLEITRALGMALGLEQDALEHLFVADDDTTTNLPLDPFWQLKLASVVTPSNDNDHSDDDESSFGVGAHTDSGFLTLLLQDDTGGLEVYTGGEWISVPPPSLSENILVCNIGECAEMASSGYFRATPHRVKIVPSGSSRRISVPFFWNPNLAAVVRPLELPESLLWDRSPVDGMFWKRPDDNAMLEQYGNNAFKSLARSHPEVFRRRHPDLTLLADGSIRVKREEIHDG